MKAEILLWMVLSGGREGLLGVAPASGERCWRSSVVGFETELVCLGETAVVCGSAFWWYPCVVGSVSVNGVSQAVEEDRLLALSVGFTALYACTWL